MDQNSLIEIGRRLMLQDNRCTSEPMFCVQIKVRDSGYDPNYADHTHWISVISGEHDEVPEGTPGAARFGYRDRWETVAVAFTKEACEEFLCLEGYRIRPRSHGGEVRISVESLQRCPEMIAIRKHLIELAYHSGVEESERLVPVADCADYDGYVHLLPCGMALKNPTPTELAILELYARQEREALNADSCDGRDD